MKKHERPEITQVDVIIYFLLVRFGLRNYQSGFKTVIRTETVRPDSCKHDGAVKKIPA